MTMARTSGRLELSFALDRRGRTRLVRQSHRFPLRITVPLYLDPADPGVAFVYVQNPTGGVFGGDELAVTLEVGAGARVHLTTQSATKVYRSVGRSAATQRTTATLAAGSELTVMPDLLIPQAGARYRQRLDVEMEDGAALITGEMVAPGRLARGERFAYDELELITSVRRAGRLLCRDVLLLDCSRRGEPLDGYDYLASVLAVPGAGGARATGVIAGDTVADRVSGALMADPELFGAADPLPAGAGVIARALARSSIAALRATETAWTMVSGRPAPPRRK